MDRRRLMNILRAIFLGIVCLVGVGLLLLIPGMWEKWNFRYYQDQYQRFEYTEAQAANPFIIARNQVEPINSDPIVEWENHILYQDWMIAAGAQNELQRQYTAFAEKNPQNLLAASFAFRITGEPRRGNFLLQALKNNPLSTPAVPGVLLEYLMRHGQVKEAETLLARIPESHWLHPYLAAQLHHRMNRRNPALAEYQKALAQLQAPISVAMACAQFLSESGELNSFNPFTAYPQAKILQEPTAVAYRMTQTPGKVSEQISQASKAILYHIDALSILANHAVRQKDYPTARWLLRRGLHFRPDHPDFLVTSGILALKENNPQRSEVLFTWGLNSQQPKFTREFHNRMGYLLLLAEQMNYAIPHLQEAKAELLENPEFQKNMGLYFAQTKQYEQAIPYLERANDQTPRDLPTLHAMSDAYLTLGKKEKAITPLTIISGMDFNNMDVRDRLANIFLEQNQLNVAISLYNLYLSRYPDSGLAYLKIAELYKKSGNLNRAAQILSSILQSKPTLQDRDKIEKTLKEWSVGNQ